MGFGLYVGFPLLNFMLIGSKMSPRSHDLQKANICCCYRSGLHDKICTLCPLTYLSSYAMYMRFNDVFGSQPLIAINASSIFGHFSDKLGRFNTLIAIISMMATSVLGIGLPVGNTRPGFLAFAIFFGFASSPGINIVPMCIGQLCWTEEYGRYYATCDTDRLYRIVAWNPR